MNEELTTLFNQYKSVNPNITEEMFNETYNNFGESYITTIQEEIKKKVEPSDSGQQIIPDVLTETQTDQVLTNNAVPNILSTPISNDLQLSQQQVDILNQQQPQNSTDSVSISAAPLLESVSTSPLDIPINLEQNSEPVLKPIQVAPVFPGNTQINNPIDLLAGKDSTDTQIPAVGFKPMTDEEISLDAETQSKKDAETNIFLKQYTDKDYLNAKIPPVEKGIEYTAWVTSPEEVQKSNENLSALEKKGDVVINGIDEKTGNFKYEILSDSYQKDFNQYINTLNSAAGEQNIDNARFNFGNMGNTPQASESVDYLNELQKEYGVLFTEEQVQQLGTPDTRRQLEINLETERRLKENPDLDYNIVLQQVTAEKQGLSEQQKLAVGNSYVRDMFTGTPDNFLDDEKDEYRFYQQYFTNPENVAEFGDFMNDTGKAMFDSSWVRSNKTKKEQSRRKDMFETFLSWKGRNDRLDLEINQRAFEDSEAKAKKYRVDNNVEAYQSEVENMNTYLSNYNAANDKLQARNQEYNSIQNNFSKTLNTQKEKDEFQLRVQNGETSANVQNVLGNVLLGAETSVQNAVTGILRIASAPLGRGNASDTINMLSEPISVGNVDIARISDKVINYKQGNKEFKSVNGTLYGKNADGTLYRDNNTSVNNLEKVSEQSEYNVSGLAFVTSKMLADILITQRVGGAITGTTSRLSTALANSKRIAAVFGEESQIAKLASSYARISNSPSSAMVNGWTVQMYNDNYMAAKQGGIKSDLNAHLYAATTSYVLALIQKINPDTNFLKTINTEQKAIVSALMENNTQKALLAIESFSKKALTNTSKELVEENVQQLTQDFINLTINSAKNKNLQVSDVQGYKDTFVGTIVPSIIASGLGGRVNQAEVGGRKIDLTNLTRNELVTELARTQEGLSLLEDFRDNAYFTSQENEADKIVEEVKLRQKYINKIPDAENYSTQTINEVIPLLQEIDNKKQKQSTAEDTFKERIQQEVQTLSTEVNSILDNNQNNEQTTQPAQESEAVQEQASIIESQPEQITTPTVAESSITETPEQIQNRVKNKSLFKNGGSFSNILGGSGVESNISGQSEINGVEFVQFSNPNNGLVDVIMTGTSDRDFVGYYRIYENGEPTNKWSSKVENQSRNKENFKTMMTGVQDLLPANHEYTEKTSISTDGLRVWNQQLRNGYEIATDENGNIITNEVMINGDSIVNDLGVNVNQGNFDPVDINTQSEFETAKKAVLPKLLSLGLNEDNIRWDRSNNTIKIDLPVLRKNQTNASQENNQNVTEQSVTETPIQFGNQTNDTIENIQSTESESNQAPQIVQIDETIFNDETDLNEEQEQIASAQLSDAVSLFESFNTPTQTATPTQNSRVSANGKYNVVERTSDNGITSFELLDINDNPVNLTNKQKDVYVAEYINSKEYPETEIDLVEGMQPGEVLKETINKTQNPKELAQVIVSTPQFDSQAVVGSKAWAIAQVIGGNNVSRESFIQNDDSNNITNAIGRTYFGKNKSGKSLDVIAQQASEQLTGDYSGESVTPQDIVDFIKSYPNDPSKAERPNNPLYDEAVAKFITLTGQNPTKNLLDKLIPAQSIEATRLNLQSAESEYNNLTAEQQNALSQEYDNWFIGLSNEQKIEELNKTYPDYEQSNGQNNIESANQSTSNGEGESNQNVGNQETAAQRQQGNQDVNRISESEFNSLIEQLKKPFKNAFKNLNVTTNLEEATKRANELGENTSDLELTNTNGNIYGFKLSDGTIYIDPNNLNANTPIHEFSHLWEQLMPNAWRNGMAIFKDTATGKRIFNQLKSEGNYSTLTDDQIWSEALNTHIGNYGEWKNNNPKGKMQQFADWIKRTFAKIGNYFGIKTTPETSLRNFTEGIVGDLLGGREINAERKITDSTQIRKSNVKYSSNKKILVEFKEEQKIDPSNLDLSEINYEISDRGRENDAFAIVAKDNNNNDLVYVSVKKDLEGRKGYETDGVYMSDTELLKGKGLALDIMKTMVNEARKKNIIIHSSKVSLSADGRALWNRLVESGDAIRLPDIKNDFNEMMPAYETTPKVPAIQFSINKNVIPKTTFAKVVNATSSEGKQAGFNELTNSSWFNNLRDSAKEGITVDNFHNLMLDQAKLIQENDAVRRENIRKQASEKTKEKVAKVKQDAKEKIADIIDKYKTKIAEIKADTKKSARDKSLEQKRALRTAVKDIKSHLASNLYIGRITPTETNRLIRKASEIGIRKDISAAVNEFTKLYDDIRAKAESRLKQKEFTLDEYNELKPIIKEAIDNNKSLADIYNAIRSLKLSNKRAGVLNEMYETQIENIYNEVNNEKLTPEEAYAQMKAKQNEALESMQDKRTRQQKIKSAIRLLIKNWTDRQYLPKKLLKEIGAGNTANRIVAMAGSSSRANEIYSELDEKIFKGLKLEEKTELNALIVAKRILAIEKNRADRGLSPIKHPYANPAKALEAMKAKIGDEKYSDLENRASEYFKAFKNILGDMRDNGLISQDSYDNMIDIDYQPRLFIDRLLNAEGNLDEDGNFQNFSGQNGGLKSEIMKSLDSGSDSAIIDNAEWLLKTALSSRYKAMAMNEVNRKFMTDEFWKAKDRFDNIDPQNFTNKYEKKFYEYFNELRKLIKDNPIIGATEAGNPKYQYDSTPQGFKKAYYYVDGVRNEFFLENSLHETWHDVSNHPIFNDKSKRVASILSGSALIKAMATGYNPTFAFTNTPRDFMQTLVFSPEYSNNLLMGTFQLGYDQVKAITRMYKSDFQGKEDEIFQKYIEYGGGMDFLHVQGLLDGERKTIKGIQKVLDSNFFQVATLMKLSKWSEMMTRMAIFERSIQNQLKDLGVKSLDNITDENQKDDIYYQAVTSARSIMDFNQGGLYTKDLDAIMPYLNAATQGTRVAIDAFKRDPSGTSTRMLQAAGLMASTAIGVSYALLAMARQIGDDDEDEKKSINEIILNAYDGLSQYQRANYINIILPSKNDKGERHVFKIAKTQFVAPLSYMMEEGLLGVMRKIEGKPEKDFTKVMKETGWVANKNMTPLELNNPVDFGAAIFTKNPVAKAVITYKTGYDFFKDEVVTFDIKKSNFPRELEGYKDDNVEDFYKSIGQETGSSPARMKALVESIVTTPETNPFVTMMYGGADLTNAVIKGDSKTEVAQEVKENIAKVFTKRLVGQASDFNRMRREREEVEKEVNKAILIDEKIKLETDILAKKYAAGTINDQDIANKFQEMKVQDLDKAYKRLNEKISNKASDTRIYDIKYSTSNSNVAKAILIKQYFPEVYENSIEGEAIRAELKEFKIFSKDVIQELDNIRTTP